MPSSNSHRDVLEVLARVDGLQALTPAALEHGWRACPAELKREHVELYRGFGKRAIGLGQPMQAFDLLNEGLATWPADVELGYLAALALSRAGSSGVALERISKLQQQLEPSDAHFVSTLSLAGRLAKDKWDRLSPGPERDRQGRLAIEYYGRAFANDADPFPGINAATMGYLTGQVEYSRSLATEIYQACSQADLESYWTTATLGEACLLMGRMQEAVDWYQRAAAQAEDAVGDLASMRLQVQRLADVIPIPGAVLDALSGGRVIAFVGHMIDAPGRSKRRFPSELEEPVRQKIEAWLCSVDARFGYCSLANGADILFAECMLERGAELHVCLPFSRHDFVASSVERAGEDWVGRFEEVLLRASSVDYSTREAFLGHVELFEFAADSFCGAALLRAERLGLEASLLAVLDESDKAEAPGGTRRSVTRWGSLRDLHVIELGALLQEHGPYPPSTNKLPAPSSSDKTGVSERRVRTMLFADVKGFSSLSEEQSPAFFVRVLGMMAEVLEQSDAQPCFQNTWGDGLFLVFEDVQAGARFALGLRDAMAQTDWTLWDLPAELTIRIALHTGPVFPNLDPIIQKINYFGTQVNLAARIEPITAPGQVYVTESTAALLHLSDSFDLGYDYLGRISLAKSYGEAPLYRLRRRVEFD